jgi:hypothetical protein
MYIHVRVYTHTCVCIYNTYVGAFLKANEAEAEAYRFLGVETARLSSFYVNAGTKFSTVGR